IEFSAAAYRFGHSMVRPFYRINLTRPKPLVIFPVDLSGVPNGDKVDQTESRKGFRRRPAAFRLTGGFLFPGPGRSPKIEGRDRVQPAYKIDTSLVSPLRNLPFINAREPAMLATRNLLRGFQMGLPSGQVVAEAMGEDHEWDKNLRVGKATEEDHQNNPL